MTTEQVKNGIYRFGFYPALIILKQEQEKENYQNCQLIKQALDEIGEGREWYLSSKVDDKSIKQTYDNIIQGLNRPEIIYENMSYYIEEFREYVDIQS